MSTKIFVMTHKLFESPKDTMYVPLQVGHALKGTLDRSYLRDDEGDDNISAQNPFFSELTGMYWVWKHWTGTENVGICHYRRYPVIRDGKSGAERLLTERDCGKLLRDHDLITTEQLVLHSNYYDGFAVDHNLRDLCVTEEVIREKYPAYYDHFEKLVHDNRVYFGNICVMPKPLYDRYCTWLFDILFEVQRRIDTTGYDNYRKRVYGFLSEFLLTVWIAKNNLHVYESSVGMSAEKSETEEIKKQLSVYFEKQDIAGAKRYLLTELDRRPDVLMEASDIRGELKLCMQVIATCEFEASRNETLLVARGMSFDELLEQLKQLNRFVVQQEENSDERQQQAVFEYLKAHPVSMTAVEIAKRVMERAE